MKPLSLKINEKLLVEVDSITKQNHISRNAYINEALAFYNEVQRRKYLKTQLTSESNRVSKTSVLVLKEMEALEDLIG